MNKVNRIVLGMCLLVAFSAIPDAWGDGFPCPVPAYLGCGFLYTGGTFSSIKFPGADLTFADGINDAGQIVGNYTTAAPGFGSFLYNAGTFSTISFPGAGGQTLPWPMESTTPGRSWVHSSRAAMCMGSWIRRAPSAPSAFLGRSSHAPMESTTPGRSWASFSRRSLSPRPYCCSS